MIDSMNDTFENTRFKVRGTMTRMLRMAENTGIGWRMWILFFFLVCLIFWYARLF
ncbi:hypothetical protein ABW21_db0202893 [Orbilia brochopaga]|nr:hypothetical protein ABW21_db0202893 [Drechslerella brochopaga]